MAIALYALDRFLGNWLASPVIQQILWLSLIIAAGLATFGIAAQLSGAASVGELKVLLRRRRTPA